MDEKRLQISAQAWAFEFLRRNQTFVDAVGPYRHRQLHPDKARVIEFSGAERLAQFSVLYCERADVPASTATVFWSPDVNRDAVDARIVASRALNEQATALHINRLPHCVCLSRESGDQIIVVAGGHQMQINCVDGTAFDEDGVIIPQISPERDARRQMLNIRRLLHLYTQEARDDELFRPYGHGARLNEVLTALDAWRADLPLRDIATILFGHKTVKEDWCQDGGYLIDRVRRSIRRGRHLMEWGYRSFLN